MKKRNVGFTSDFMKLIGATLVASLLFSVNVHAEEVEEFLPEAALYENGQVEDWNYRVMIPVMLQMIKDLRSELKELKN